MIEKHAKFLEDNDGNDDNNINIDRNSSSSNRIFIVEESCTGRGIEVMLCIPISLIITP